MPSQGVFVDDPDGGKRAVLTTRPWELLGFGCHYAWLLSIAFGTTMYARFESVDLIVALRLLIFIGITVMFASLVFAQRFTSQFMFKRPIVIAAGTTGVVGTLLLLVPASGFASWVVWVIAALCIGFSNAVSMTAGNRLWANNRPEYGMLQLTVSTVLAVVLFYALLLAPFEVALPVIAALPLIGDVILALTRGGKQRTAAYRKYDAPAPRADRRLLVYVFAFAASTGCMLAAVLSHDVASMAGSSGEIMVGALLASVFTLAAALRKKPAGMLKLIDKPIFALFVVGIVGLLMSSGGLLPSRSTFLWGALVMSAYVLADQFLWLINPDIVFRAQKPSAVVLARSCSIEWAGLAFGFFLGCASRGYGGNGLEIEYPVALFACLCAFAAMRTFSFSHADAVKLAEARLLPSGEGELVEHCQVLAEQYGLSLRETEVFLMLARGRSGPFIQEELTLSQSTVKTHTRNIYRKMGIASKQELIDLVRRDI